MIYNEQPKDFVSSFEVVCCFLENNGEFLILHRQDHKPQGNTWCLPSGKVEKNEDIKDAVLREVEEETSLIINPELINYFNKFYVRYPEYDFIYHIFHFKTEEKPKIVLEKNGHKDFKWITPNESLKMNNLIEDLDTCIEMFYGIK